MIKVVYLGPFLRANVNKRIERYSRLLTEIESIDDLYAPNSPLQLTDEERKSIITYLDSDLYHSCFCKYVLLRLDEALAGSGASYSYSIITIEHVLPQNPGINGAWSVVFPDVQIREGYVHRLGNPVLLAR
jgi:hypothetical protein